MHLVTLGDVVLDVIVDVPDGLRQDDDSEAVISLSAGGQAANVASWAAELGARATLIGPRGDSPAATLVADRLQRQGVRFSGIGVTRSGTVLSILADGSRTLASDAGDQRWLSQVGPASLPAGADWLHLSAYPLLRATDPTPIVALAAAARAQGCGISIDLSSASLLAAYGVERFGTLLDDLEPTLVFANQSEWDTLRIADADAHWETVVKRGAAGVVVTPSGGQPYEHPAPVATVADLTGAGDALAAGYLVGGVALGLAAAARCVSQVGAQPVEK